MGCGMSKKINIEEKQNDRNNNNDFVEELKNAHEETSITRNEKTNFQNHNNKIIHQKMKNEVEKHASNMEITNKLMNSTQSHTCNGTDHSQHQRNSTNNCATEHYSKESNGTCQFIDIKSNQPSFNKINETRLQRLQAKKFNSSTLHEDIEQSISSPFGQRKTLTLSESQVDFFRMLDDKIAQGKDYCSEDERSISSLLSRKSRSISNGSHTTFMSLQSQHVR